MLQLHLLWKHTRRTTNYCRTCSGGLVDCSYCSSTVFGAKDFEFISQTHSTRYAMWIASFPERCTSHFAFKTFRSVEPNVSRYRYNLPVSTAWMLRIQGDFPHWPNGVCKLWDGWKHSSEEADRGSAIYSYLYDLWGTIVPKLMRLGILSYHRS